MGISPDELMKIIGMKEVENQILKTELHKKNTIVEDLEKNRLAMEDKHKAEIQTLKTELQRQAAAIEELKKATA